MSSRLTRPRRTKVYDCNYTMGERYYRPVVDDLDRRYTSRGAISDAANAADASISSLRSTLSENENSLSSTLRRAAIRAVDVDEEREFSRRRPASNLLAEYDSIFDTRGNSGNMSKSRQLVASSLEDDEDATITNNLKRLRAARAARRDIEDEVSTITTSTTRRSKPSATEFSEKVMDTVGLKNSDIGKARLALAEDSISRRVLKMTTSSEDGESSPGYSKWCKVTDTDAADDDYDMVSASRARKAARQRMADLDAEFGDDRAADAAKERARKSRARLADLDAEMEALTERGAAREKRAANLRALIQDNERNSESSTKSAIRVKKVSSTVQSEKKTVSF